MVEGGIYILVIPLFRTLVGFGVGVFLGILGGWSATIFNAMMGYPWDVDIHRNIYLGGVGLGAGAGAFLGWMNLTLRWRLNAASLLLIMLGGVAGTYAGMVYAQNSDSTYLGRAYTIENGLHFGAAIGSIIVATALGLLNEIRRPGH
jgi:hypothetical protein